MYIIKDNLRITFVNTVIDILKCESNILASQMRKDMKRYLKMLNLLKKQVMLHT